MDLVHDLISQERLVVVVCFFVKVQQYLKALRGGFCIPRTFGLRIEPLAIAPYKLDNAHGSFVYLPLLVNS